MTVFNWTVTQLERRSINGSVIAAHWRCDATDGEYTAGSYGTAGFAPDPEAPNFIPFEQLTEADVIGWLPASEGFDKKQIEAGLQAQIDTLKTPPVIAGVPWKRWDLSPTIQEAETE